MSKPERLARRTVYTSNWVVRCRATSGTGEFDHNEGPRRAGFPAGR